MKGGLIVTGFGLVGTILLAPVAIITGIGAGLGIVSVVDASRANEEEKVLLLKEVAAEPVVTEVVSEKVEEPKEENVQAKKERSSAAGSTSSSSRSTKARSSTPSSRSSGASTSTRSSRQSRARTSPPAVVKPEPVAPIEDDFGSDEELFDEAEEMNIDEALEDFKIDMLDEEEDTKKKKKKKR